MKINFNVNIWTFVVIGLMIFGAFNWNRLSKEIDRWQRNYEVAEEGKGELEVRVSELDSTLIYTQRAYEVTQKELREVAKSDSTQRELVKYYKDLAAAVKIETVVEIEEVPVPYPVYVDKDTIINVINPCYSLDFNFQNHGLSIQNFSMYNTQDIVLGDLKRRFWKTEQSVTITNSNPCISTTGVTTYQIVVPHKWYNKWWITGPIGFAAGYAVGKF